MTIAVEFDCVQCGRHIISLGYNPPGNETCAACLAMPGWYNDPEIARRIDPGYNKRTIN